MPIKKYAKRYVLAEGYPWFYGIGPYLQMAMQKDALLSRAIPLRVPKELWAADVPKFRLVLELLPAKRKKSPTASNAAARPSRA